MLYSFFLYLSRRLFPNLANVTFRKNRIFKKSRVNGGKGKWIWEYRGGSKKIIPRGSSVEPSSVPAVPVPCRGVPPCCGSARPCVSRHGIGSIAIADYSNYMPALRIACQCVRSPLVSHGARTLPAQLCPYAYTPHIVDAHATNRPAASSTLPSSSA